MQLTSSGSNSKSRMGSMGRILGFVLVISGLASAGAKPSQEPATTTYAPQELVRRMVETELRAQDQDHSKWHFISRTEQGGKLVVTEKVQTSGGTLKRVVALNGKPLPPDERAKEDEQLDQYVHDRRLQEKKLRDEREDARKAREMFRMFPDAFLYTHAGEEQGLTKLHFTPNPNFDPPTREAMVFHAMSGMMWIDPKQMRFARMQAALTDDVKFGFGLLGYLKRGGTFLVEQKEVGPGHWEVTTLNLNLHGKAILLKSISVQQKEENSDFQRLEDGIDLAKGLAILRNPNQVIARVGGK